MKKLVVSFVVTLLALTGFAQQEQKVLQAMQQLHKAMVEADSSQLFKMTSSQLTYGHSSGKVENQSTFIKNILSGASNFERIDTSVVSVTVAGHTAIVRHVLHGITNDNGVPSEVNLKIMLVFIQHKKSWQLLGRQAVK